ncbi:APC family permease [Candidatus Nitrospira bockiana]
MAHPDAPHDSKAHVGWFTAACLVVSNVIGGGIFTTTGFLARDLGDPILIISVWVGGGLLALAAALSYSELPAMLPRAGGDYVYLTEAYGPLAGFLSGWTSFTVGFGAGIAAASVSFAAYAGRVVGLPETEGPAGKALALFLVWSMTAVHLAGVRAGGRLQRLLTTTKVGAILIMIVAALSFGHGDWAHFGTRSPHTPSLSAFIVALIFVLYTYIGWNVVGYVAGEISDPQRTIPKVVIGGMAFVMVLYVLLNLVYTYALPIPALADPPLLPVTEKAVTALWGSASGRLVAALLCVSIAGGVSAMVWAGPRVYWAMAEDGVFAPAFRRINARTAVPDRAMYVQSAWASVLILTGTFEQLVVFSGFTLSAFTALTIGAVIVLRRRRPDLARPYRVPLYPLVPALVIGVLLVVVGYSMTARPVESVLGLATVLSGVPFYLFWRQSSH